MPALTMQSGQMIGVLAKSGSERTKFAELAAQKNPILGSDPFRAFTPGQTIARQMGSTTADERVAALEAVGLNFECAWRFPHEFSAGQLQRLSLSRALAAQPSVLVCNDAISQLDAISAGLLLDCLDSVRLMRPGMGVLFLAKEPQFLPADCDHFYQLADGELVDLPAPVPNIDPVLALA